jgi:NADPH-ferrihemoprotein reductase
MKKLSFTVFGLGNTQYEHYNAMGKLLDKELEKLGGTRVFKYGEGDDNSSLEDDFNEWKNNIWVEL